MYSVNVAQHLLAHFSALPWRAECISWSASIALGKLQPLMPTPVSIPPISRSDAHFCNLVEL